MALPGHKENKVDFDQLRLTKDRGTTRPASGSGTKVSAPKSGVAKNYFCHYIDAHLKILGTWGNGQVRLFKRISTQEYDDILRKNTTSASAPSNFAINLPSGQGGGMRKGSNATGLIMNYSETEKVKIAEELFQNGHTVQVQKDQLRFLDAMFSKARKENKERSAFIVFDHPSFTLSFSEALPDEIINATSEEVRTKLGMLGDERFLPPTRPGHATKQVIGMVHTHYKLSIGSVVQNTTQGTSFSGKPKQVSKMVYEISKQDIDDAATNHFVNYALDDKYIHIADQFKKVRNKNERSMDVLEDCLKTFSEVYR